MFGHEKLEIWQEAIDFADLVYTVNRGVPADGRFGLTSLMRHAAVAISSNLAEGGARPSRRDFARFIEIATASVHEALSQSRIGLSRGTLSEIEFQVLCSAAGDQRRMLGGLRRSLFGDG